MFFKSILKAGKRPDPLVLNVAPAPGIFAGTLVETPDGPVRIEDVRIGTQVLTEENGPKDVVGLETAKLSVASHAAAAGHWPLLIPEGALGNTASLVVAPSMRIVMQHGAAGAAFGFSQVSLRAENLIGYRGIARAQVARDMAHVTLQFKAPEIVKVQGGVLFDIPDAAQVHTAMPLSDRQARQLMRDITSGSRALARPISRPGLAWI